AGELGAEMAGDLVGDALVLEGLAEALADGKPSPVVGIKVLARGVMELALARYAAQIRCGKWQSQDLVDGILRQAALHEPMAVGSLGAPRGIDAPEQRRNERVLGARHACVLRKDQ